MKIAGFATQVVELPGERGPLGEIPGRVSSRYVTLRLRTDDGIEGIAYAAYVSRAMVPALKAALDGLCELAIGRDPFETEQIGHDLRMANGGTAPAGLVTRASSAIDIALWDIKGKALGLPCWKLLGGSEGPRARLRQRPPLAPLRPRRAARVGPEAGGSGLHGDEAALRRRSDARSRGRAHARPARGRGR